MAAIVLGCSLQTDTALIIDHRQLLAIVTNHSHDRSAITDTRILGIAELIRGWWIWAYWISPLSFTVRSLALNEFTTKQWSAPYEYDPSITIGEASLAVFDIQTGYWWVWLGVGVLAGYAIVFNVIATLAFTFLSCESTLAPLLLALPSAGPSMHMWVYASASLCCVCVCPGHVPICLCCACVCVHYTLQF